MSNPVEAKPLHVVPIPPPPMAQRVHRDARFAQEDEKKTRYHLPDGVQSASPIGYRHRVSMTQAEGADALKLLSLTPPKAFVPAPSPITEAELFEESSLGILRSRQSTNYRGHRQTTLGPARSAEAAALLRQLDGLDVDVLDNAAYTHFFFSRPYRTPFTLLLTFIGHKPILSLLTVPIRALRKRFQHINDIPTIGYLQQLHLGILAEAVEKAAIIASNGARRANVIVAPFCDPHRQKNRALTLKLEAMTALGGAPRSEGWRLAMVAQVGQPPERFPIAPQSCRKIGANLLAFRSERIQPGVNAEEKAPPQYQSRQDMDVPEELTTMAGRAAFNAFARWTGCEREKAKTLLLMDRIDVLTDGGKERLRGIREELGAITDRVVETLPLWADLPLMKALSRNAQRGRKAFALTGQRIYVGGLSRPEIEAANLSWERSVRAVGAAAARSGLVCELMGCVDLPDGCDLLAGLCLMAGPVNQNDVGKSFFGYPDMLRSTFPDRNPTSMLVWTLKAKTIADPIGNEEQLLNARRKGALVDLRPGPHDVILVEGSGGLKPMRKRDGQTNTERAFSDFDNFVTDPDGREIPGNRGAPWPNAWRQETLWT